MPFSNLFHLAPVVHFVNSVPNQRILDAGIGTGSYGFILRQTLEIAEQRLEKATWMHQIDGIEIFEQYRNPVWDFAYDRVHMGDIRTILQQVGSYDVVVCCDVLEHFPRAEASQLVRRFLERAPVLIATTPIVDIEQGAWGGNEAERHHCLLAPDDFAHLVVRVETGATACYVCSTDPALARRLRDAALNCPSITLPPWQRFEWRVRRRLRAALGA
jgi:hypothetical protein